MNKMLTLKVTNCFAKTVLSPKGRCSSMLMTTQLEMIVRMITYLQVIITTCWKELFGDID